MNTLKIRGLRKAHGLTQAELANAIGVSTRSLQHWERHESNITLKHASALAAFFKVDISYLLNKETPTEKKEESTFPEEPDTVAGMRKLLEAKNELIALQEKHIKMLEEKSTLAETILESLNPHFQKLFSNQDILASALGNIVLDMDEILDRKKKKV